MQRFAAKGKRDSALVYITEPAKKHVAILTYNIDMFCPGVKNETNVGI